MVYTSRLLRKAKSVTIGVMGSLLLGSILTSCKIPHPTTPEVPSWVMPYWGQAQMQLIEAGVENARLVPPDRFRFIGHEPDCVDNGGNLTGYMDSDLDWCVWGTFDPPRRIDYSTAQKNVIVHEALHAILYTLGYDCWADIDREEAGCPR